MAALPFTISFIVFTGRFVRRASSACDILRSSRASRRISPGGTAQAGRQPLSALAVMVVHDLQNSDRGDAGTVHTPVDVADRDRIRWFKYKSVGLPEMQRELTVAIG